jgi:hypothetical protein
MPEIHRQVSKTTTPKAADLAFVVIAGPQTAQELGVPEGSIVTGRDTSKRLQGQSDIVSDPGELQRLLLTIKAEGA